MSDQADWIVIIEYSLGSLSVTGCLFVIFVFLCYKEIRSFAFESVAYLTISSMMTSVSYLMYYIKPGQEKVNNAVCETQAFLMVWFENSQYLWATLIGCSVYQQIINFEENNFKTSWRKRCKYLLIGYILPLCMSIICYFRGVFGPSGTWCWISTKGSIGDEDLLEHSVFLVLFYSLEWILILINFVLTMRVIYFLDKNYVTREEREITKVFIWKLLRYPFIQALCIFPSTINRLCQIFFDYENIVLQKTQIVFVSLQGLIYAIAYGYNPQVRQRLMKTFRAYCYCCICLFPSGSRRGSDISDSSIDQSQKLYDKSNNHSESHVSF
jgi:hypothetical protein